MYKINEKDIRFLLSKDFTKTSFKFPNDYGWQTTKKHFANEDILLFENEIFAKEDIYFQPLTTYSFNNLSFRYIIKGNVKSRCLLSKEDLYSTENSTQIALLKDYKYSSWLKGHFKSFCVCVSEKFLNYYFSDLYKAKKTKILKNYATSFKSQLIIQEIINSPYNGKMNEMYLYGKIIELVFLEFFQINNKTDKQITFSQYDKNAIKKAKEILIENIKNPPTIAELSKLVCLNEFKLKRGFKIYHDMSPYQLVINHKMAIAKNLLRENIMNVNEISNHLGYKHPQSFTTAFKKYCGINPKTYSKK